MALEYAKDHFTAALDDVVRVIGPEAMNRLIARYPGVTVHVPNDIDLSHPLVAVVGTEAARRLANYMGNCQLYVPKLAANKRRERDREIRTRHADGCPPKTLAIKFGLCERQIRTILSAPSAVEQNQLDLFNANE